MKKKALTGISEHFKTEAKIILGLFLVLALLSVVAAYVGPWVLHQIDIRKCLDRGESYDYGNKQCNFVQEGHKANKFRSTGYLA